MPETKSQIANRESHMLMMQIISAVSLMIMLGGCAAKQQAAPATQSALGRQMDSTAEGFLLFWDNLTGNSALQGVQMMEDRYFADERREGIAKLSARSFGRQEPYTTRYAQIAQQDSDYLVRAMAVRSLNRSRDQSATPVFIEKLADAERLVRLEAAKALANVPDDNAIEPLLKVLANEQEDRDVRIAAADALRHYRTLAVARGLISQLGARDFAIAWQSNQSLRISSGKDFKYDQSAWLEFITAPQTPFG